MRLPSRELLCNRRELLHNHGTRKQNVRLEIAQVNPIYAIFAQPQSISQKLFYVSNSFPSSLSEIAQASDLRLPVVLKTPTTHQTPRWN